jgi:hypothetical protein
MRFQPLVTRFFLWILGPLLYLLPESFRRDYGQEMFLVFRDLLKGNRSRPEGDKSIARSELWPRSAATQVPANTSVDVSRTGARKREKTGDR